MINTAHQDTSKAAIAQVKRLLQQQGYAYLQQLPDHFDHLAFAEQIGTLIPHQYNGEYVFSIRVNPEIGDRYPAFTNSEVEPHTEAYEYEGVPMHYQGLWCVSPPTCGGGHTLLADGYRFIHSLTDSEQEYVTHHRFAFATPGGNVVKHPLYDVESGEPIVRWNSSSLKHGGNCDLEPIVQRFVEWFETHKITIQWSKNAFLIWDNFRMLHSRTLYQDNRRELKRIYLN